MSYTRYESYEKRLNQINRNVVYSNTDDDDLMREWQQMSNSKRILRPYVNDQKIAMNDFMAIEEFIEENEFFNLYDELSELAKQEYPGTILPSYYKGRFIEETGDPKKAMYIYRSAYNMKEVKGLTKEYLLELAERIKEDFNY